MKKQTVVVLAAAALLILAAPDLWAANTGMPWEGKLDKILDSITGPVAKVFGALIIFGSGIGLAAGEGGSGVRKLIWVVFGLSIAFTASSFMLGFLGFGNGAIF